MARLVDPYPKPPRDGGATLAAGGPNPKTPKEYFGRVAKYIPAEVIAGYIAINGAIEGLPDAFKFNLWIANLSFCLVFTPMYVYLMREPGKPYLKHIVIATLAFPVWAYAIDGNTGLFGNGDPAGLGIYYGGIASILLIVFSMVSGLFWPEE